MRQLKVCGLRDRDNTLVAADSGADFLGFVFVPGARRQVSVQQAQTIIKEYRRLRPQCNARVVGLFANQPPDEVNSIIQKCHLNLAQLCGHEDPPYWEKVLAPIIRQIRVDDQKPRSEVVSTMYHNLQQVNEHGHLAILDSYQTGIQGGTGKIFDWSIASQVAIDHKFFLAGGLTAKNVRKAINKVNPLGVDVSTGVETDGVKDPLKIAAFARAVHNDMHENN